MKKAGPIQCKKSKWHQIYHHRALEDIGHQKHWWEMLLNLEVDLNYSSKAALEKLPIRQALQNPLSHLPFSVSYYRMSSLRQCRDRQMDVESTINWIKLQETWQT